jgi:hypothetical protein
MEAEARPPCQSSGPYKVRSLEVGQMEIMLPALELAAYIAAIISAIIAVLMWSRTFRK